MWILLTVITIWCSAISASPLTSSHPQRIIGGEATTIDNYPSIVGYLAAHDGVNYVHNCGGAILNERTILTAAHCNVVPLNRCRIRVGSSYGNSGGAVHNIARIISHEDYSTNTLHHDIGILHTATHIILSDVVQLATIAGPNLQVPDNDQVWAAGWGLMDYNGTYVKPEQLRHVALVSIATEQCKRYFSIVTENMLCAGSINNQGNGGQCIADSGSPLYYMDIVVGVSSFTSLPCGRADSASVNTRVSSYTGWVLDNAFS